jgi:hypothetical protein
VKDGRFLHGGGAQLHRVMRRQRCELIRDSDERVYTVHLRNIEVAVELLRCQFRVPYLGFHQCRPGFASCLQDQQAIGPERLVSALFQDDFV